MSLKKLAFISAVGFLIGGLGTAFVQALPSRQTPSENLASKIRFKGWGKSLKGKTHQSIQVQVFAIGEIPETDHQEIHLRAQVLLNRAVGPELHYQWTLPEGATLVSGRLQETWTQVQAGQVLSTEITVRGVSKESVAKTVTLHVSGTANGVQYASSGSFATNSPSQMTAADTSAQMKASGEELVLKKTRSAEKMDQLHQ